MPSSTIDASRPAVVNSSVHMATDSSSRGIPYRGAPENTVGNRRAASRPSTSVRKPEESRQLLGLEVGPEAPVPEHLEEGRVPAVTDDVDVLGPEAGLRIDEPVAARVRLAEQVGKQGLHP